MNLSFKTRSISTQFRMRRLRFLMKLINDTYDKYRCVNILDAGGTREYWDILSEQILNEKKIKITVVNLKENKFDASVKHFEFIQADCCNLSSISDKSFHIAHSNSVLEHVGNWIKMKSFASEIARIAETYFVQTPNYWFPIEPHCMTPFFHWLPKCARVSLVMRFNLGNWNRRSNEDDANDLIESIHLIDESAFKKLFIDAKIVHEKSFFMTKSLIAIKDYETNA